MPVYRPILPIQREVLSEKYGVPDNEIPATRVAANKMLQEFEKQEVFEQAAVRVKSYHQQKSAPKPKPEWPLVPTKKPVAAPKPWVRNSPEKIKEYRAMKYRDYLLTPWWKKIKTAAIRRVDARCQVCNKRGMLHVHHRTYEDLGDEWDMDLTVLCEKCHDLYHASIPKPRK